MTSAAWRYLAAFLQDQHPAACPPDWEDEEKHRRPPWGTAGCHTSSAAEADLDQDQVASEGSVPVACH